MGRSVEVLAIGVNAWGPFHEFGYVRKFGTFEADLTVVCLPIGDIYRPLYGLSKLPFFAAEHPPRLALEEVATFAIWKVRERQLGPTSPQDLRWHGEQGIRAYVDLARTLRTRGVEVMFEALPTRAAAFGVPPADEARDVERLTAALAAESDIHVGYPTGRFAGRDPEGLYHLLEKSEQPAWSEGRDWRAQFGLD